MSVGDLSCLVCHQPAVMVLSIRLDQGIVHYPACARHVGRLCARLERDATRALDNLGVITEVDVIDTTATDVLSIDEIRAIESTE